MTKILLVSTGEFLTFIKPGQRKTFFDTWEEVQNKVTNIFEESAYYFMPITNKKKLKRLIVKKANLEKAFEFTLTEQDLEVVDD